MEPHRLRDEHGAARLGGVTVLRAKLRSLAAVLRRRPQFEDEMAQELQFHIEARADDLMSQSSITRKEALRRARLEFGSVERYKEEGREARGLRLFDQLRADARYSIGQLRKYPVFTITAILTIALGVAINTAMFSLINGGLLKPLPVRNPDQLTRLTTISTEVPIPNAQLSFPDYRDSKSASDIFEDIAVWDNEFHALTFAGRTNRVITSAVSGNYFSMLGVQPFLGRLIRPADGELGGTEPIVVLGYSFWSRHLAGDASIVGKEIKMNGQTFTVIGVLPKTFHGTDSLVDFDAYLPLELSPVKAYLDNRSTTTVRAIARLKPGVTVESAQAALDTISWRLQDQYPQSNAKRRLRVFPERRSRPDPAVFSVMPAVVATLLLLSGAVLLIASVNVLSLFLSRGLARRGEMAVRAALGASRWQLMRVCLVEAFLISAAGGLMGTASAAWATGFIENLQPKAFEGVSLRMDAGVDWRVVAYAATLVVITTLVVGVVPALRSARTNPNKDLQDIRTTIAPQRQRLRQSLVAAQLAISVAFLMVAGMFIESLRHLQSLDLGFARDHILLVDVDPATAGYNDAQALSLHRTIESRLRGVAGVQSVSEAVFKPFGNSMFIVGASAEGQDPSLTGALAGTEMNFVSPDYFQTMGIPFVQGRAFTEFDGQSRTPMTIVSDTMAEDLWPGQSPIGKRFRTVAAPDLLLEVVGVVKSSKLSNGLQPRRPARPQFFLPSSQSSLLGRPISSSRTFYIRTAVAPESLASTIQSEIRSIDANVLVQNVVTMEEQVGSSLNGFGLARTAVLISAVVGLLALVLALVGAYGSLAFMVGQRTQEIGVRIALGAAPAAVLKMIIWQGLKLAFFGIVGGAILGAQIGGLIQTFLFDVSPLDPLILIFVIAVLVIAALLTSVIPARRALTIDPILALRSL